MSTKKRKTVLVTGSSGLVGSTAAGFFIEHGYMVIGVDNNMRKSFFGNASSTLGERRILEKQYGRSFICHGIDIRNTPAIRALFRAHHFDIVVHTAAQPSHEWSAHHPVTDFDINAVATLALLECTRMFSPDAVFLFTSTNKVYGDTPNRLSFIEKKTRWELPVSHRYYDGIDESMSIDTSTHSIFGVSKMAADIMVQEYGRYFGLYTTAFRCGCITGAHHLGSVYHGFLSYLAKCVANNIPYTIYGYKGKQVRDIIHATDLVRAMYAVTLSPKQGAVYNMGGSRASNISVVEAIAAVERILSKKLSVQYVDMPRKGDHQWYISNVQKFHAAYPKWKFHYTIDTILQDLCVQYQ